MPIAVEGTKASALHYLPERLQSPVTNRLIEKIKQIASALFAWIASVFTYFQKKEPPISIAEGNPPPIPPSIPELLKEDSFPPLAGEDPAPSPAAAPALARRNSMDGQRPLVPCSEEHQRVIEYIFSTVSAGGPELFFKASTLRDEEKKIAHLHPFTLLTTVKSQYIREIWNSLISKKKADLMDGITKSMFREHQDKRLACHVDHFASKMKKDPRVIMGLFARQNWNPGQQDWTGFMKYLFDLK